MSDEKSKIEEVASALKTVSEAVPVYQDTVQPAAREIGKALKTTAQAMNVALAPIRGVIWGYEQFEEFLAVKVAKKLERTPIPDIVTPPLNIAGPAMEALRYAGHAAELQEMYANLLAASMDTKTSVNSHPSFVEILKQITPDEAVLLSVFVTAESLPIITVMSNTKEEDGGGIEALVNFSVLGEQAGCHHQQLVPSYLSNFCRLGIIEIPVFYEYVDNEIYAPLENHPTILSLRDEIEKSGERRASINRSGARITELGKNFIRTCVVPHEEKRQK